MKIIDITPQIQQKDQKIRLAPYARVSSNSEDQLHSFAAQIRYYTQYVQEHPVYELVDIYADEGITGTEMEKRGELNRLLRDCKLGKIDRVICKSISRFARNTEELLVALRMLKGLGVSIYFEEQDIDSEKLNMEMIVTFPGMIAQQESENISGNLRWSIHKRMESGEFNCTCPAYGYSLINGEMVINESEAEIIRRIFRLYLQGTGVQSIANILNDEQVPRRYGKTKWYQSSIVYILKNERYIGDALLQKKYTTDTLPYRKRPNKGQKPQYYVENSHVAIISREIFEKAQGLLKVRAGRTLQQKTYPLTGKIRCPECGRTFRRQQINDKAYWFCMKTAAAAGHCLSRRVREDMVYECFINMIYKLKEYRKRIIGFVIRNLTYNRESAIYEQDEIHRIDKMLADLSAKNLVIARLQSKGILQAAEFTLQTSEINQKISALRAKRKQIIEQEDDELYELQELNELIESCKPSNQFDVELFERIVEKIVVNDCASLTFYLIGGLALTETIEEKGRCNVL